MPYIGRPLQAGVRRRYIYAATAGQTSFSGNDSSGISLAYDDSLFLDVYQNGVLLKPVTDYASTTGTSVVLTTGASTDDVLEMLVFDTFGVADTVSAKDGGSFAGAVSMASTLAVTGSLSGTTGTFSGAVSGTRGTFTDNVVMTSDDPTITMTDSSGTNDIATLQATSGALIINVRDGSADGEIIFKKTDGSATDETMRIDSSGRVTKSLQPAFQARPASTQDNIAINSNVDVVFGTEVFDVGANFASNTFTAPVAGKYFLSTSIRLNAVDSAANYYLCTIVTSNRNYQFIFDPDFGQDANYWVTSISHIADMDASDTAKVQVVQTAGTSQTDITNESTFSGALIC